MLKVLGRGGMGFVFLAEDLKLRRRVALKVMRPAEARKKGAKDRFLREARAAAAVEHDNVVTIHQVGEDRGIPFIAMPLLQGESLRSVLARETKLPQERVLAIAVQVAAGLHAAHQTGMIHRDIKPDNLWIDSAKERVKILDFGLVRELDNEDGLTIHGTVLGTPSYMSPEQAAGETVDHRSDLFSLGAVLYQMLSGKSPYAGSNLTSTLINVTRAQPQPLNSLVSGLDDELLQLIEKLNSRDPNDRPESAADVVATLKRIETRLSRQSERGSPESRPPLLDPASTVKPPTASWRKYAIGSGGAAAILLAVTFLVQMGKYQVQITIDDPSIALKVDGNDILIEDAKAVTRLSAGPHKLTVNRAGLSTLTDEFHVTKDGKNVIHVAIVNGQFAIDTGHKASSTPSPNSSEPIPGTAELTGTVDAPERKAATWMRSIQPPLAFRLMSLRDANQQWEFLPESTEPIPTEPFRIYTLHLHVNYTNQYRDETAEALAPNIRGVRGLYALSIGSDRMTLRGLEKVLEIPEFHDIEALDIGGVRCDDRIFDSIAKLPKLTNLHFAKVTELTGKGISALRACPDLNSVGWTLSSPSVESFEELAQLPHLITIELNAVAVTEAHALALAKLNLRNLALNDSGLNDAMVSHFAALKQLNFLNLSVGEITDQECYRSENLSH